MKNQELWQESKYAKNKHGRWSNSKNTKEVAIGSRLITSLVARWYEANIPSHVQGRLLDLGCGKVPLYGIYKPYATDIYCMDWENSLHPNHYVDQFCDLNQPLELPDNSFDTIILSDVLEHIAEPQQLFCEMQRVLRPNGKILLSVPFCYHIHEAPHDYFRYTEYALKFLAQKVQMEVVSTHAIGGSGMVVADILSKKLATIPYLKKLLCNLIVTFTANGIYNKQINNDKSTSLPLEYCLIMQKLK